MLNYVTMFSNVTGKHEKHVSLPYRPYDVCCSADYIFVAEMSSPAVHVYSWTGLLIQTLPHKQLGVRENHEIYAIQCSNDGSVLQLAIGGAVYVRSVRAYKVSCTLMLYTTHSFFKVHCWVKMK